MDLELRHLRIVALVAQAGSVPAAATALGVSPSALGGQVARIERTLGCRIFQPTGGGVSTTPVGEKVLAHARVVLNEVQQLREDIRSHVTSAEPLRITSDSLRYFTTFVGHVYATEIRRPILPLPPLTGTTTTTAIIEGRVDAAVVIALATPDAQMRAVVGERVIVEREPLLVALSSAHPLAAERCIDIGALADEDWILPPTEIDPDTAATNEVLSRRGITLRSSYGPHDLGPLWPAVVAGRAVSFAVPTASPPPGGVLRPLCGQPITARRVLRWRHGAVGDEDLERCTRAASSAYREQLTHTAQTQDWWRTATSEEKPVLAT